MNLGSDDPGLAVTVSKLREREKKWINMLSKWSKYSNPNSKNAVQKMKNRARKGIPDSMRGRAWMFLRYLTLSLNFLPRFKGGPLT